jgi:hypothetical protein
MSLIRAEQRFGGSDGVFTIEEQSQAINALYDVARGEHAHTAPAGVPVWDSRSPFETTSQTPLSRGG